MAYLRKNYFILLLSIFTFASCDNNDNNDNDKSNLTVNDIEYRGIKYYTDSINSTKETKIEIPEVSFTNNTNETQYFISPDPYSQFKDRLIFQTSDSLFYLLNQNDSVLVDMPDLIIDNMIYYNANNYLLSDDITLLAKFNVSESYELSPYTKVSIKETIVETQYKGLFEIIYYNRKSKLDELIKGTWIRYSYGNHTSNAIIEDIKK